MVETTILPLGTKRDGVLGQLVCCLGCCCGRTDRGKPEVPVEALKSVWATEKLNRAIQLTISGCLGPCDLTNVALMMTPSKNIWLGGLTTREHYEMLIDWARACKAAGSLLELPEELDAHRFARFGVNEATAG